jgi:hypothetical protein
LTRWHHARQGDYRQRTAVAGRRSPGVPRAGWDAALNRTGRRTCWTSAASYRELTARPRATRPHGCLNSRLVCHVFPLPRERRQDSTPRGYPPSMQGKATVIAGAAIVLAGCHGPSQTAMTLTSTLEITKTVTVTAPPPPSVPKTTMETDGTYRIGTDIVPGTYRSAGPSPEGASDCYWARLSSLNETHIIDSNISTGPQVVMIQPSDRAFLTRSCQPWQKTA